MGLSSSVPLDVSVMCRLKDLRKKGKEDKWFFCLFTPSTKEIFLEPLLVEQQAERGDGIMVISA